MNLSSIIGTNTVLTESDRTVFVLMIEEKSSWNSLQIDGDKVTSEIFVYKTLHWALYHVWFLNTGELCAKILLHAENNSCFRINFVPWDPWCNISSGLTWHKNKQLTAEKSDSKHHYPYHHLYYISQGTITSVYSFPHYYTSKTPQRSYKRSCTSEMIINSNISTDIM